MKTVIHHKPSALPPGGRVAIHAARALRRIVSRHAEFLLIVRQAHGQPFQLASHPSPAQPSRTGMLPHPGGFTLMEISLVIALILGLSTLVGFSVSAVQDWQRGKSAGLSLQAVFAAQRGYMADHPTANIADVTATQLQVYLPEGWPSIPSVKGLKNETLTLNINTMPPRLQMGDTVYDPSGKSSDGLWDCGQ